jgi:hypothetical protein
MDIQMKCPRCGKEYPVMGMRLFSGETEERPAHNFCPTLDATTGKIVEVCMKCKMGIVELEENGNILGRGPK